MTKNRKQQRAHNKAIRIANQQSKANRVPKELSGPARWQLVDAIHKTQGTKTKTEQAKTWQQVLRTGDTESVYTDAQGKTQTKIKSTYGIHRHEYRTLKNKSQ